MSLRSVIFNSSLLILALGLTACTNPNVNVDFLAKNIMSSYSFKVTNAVNEKDIEPVAAQIPVEAECSSSITDVEIQDPGSQEWKAITAVDSTGKVACVEEGSTKFTLPVSFVNPQSNPSTAGDKRYDFRVRLTVKNITGEFHQYEKVLSALFKAPAVNVVTSDIGISIAGSGGSGGQYTVIGSCTVGTSLEITSSVSDTAVPLSCISGSFTAVLPLKSGLADGEASVLVKSYYNSPYYAFAEMEKKFVVDLTAPMVSIASPAESATVNNALLTGVDTFVLNGICEKNLPVTFIVTGGTAVPTTCSAAGTFSTQVIYTTQGNITIEAKQTDAVQNEGHSSVRTVRIATEGPGSFSILGVGSMDDEDNNFNEVLSGVGLKVKFTMDSTKSARYDVVIKDLSGNDQCSQDYSNSGLAGAIELGLNVCTPFFLNHGQQYKVYIQAVDNDGNTRTASNDGYTFTAQYPTPIVTGVTISPSTGNFNVNNVGQGISIQVTYDRAVTATGSLYVQLNTLSSGQKVYYYGPVGATEKVLEFKYTLAVGEFTATTLGLYDLFIGGGGAIKAKVTSVDASRTLPSVTTSTRIDTIIPGSVAANLGAVPPYYTESPVINFTLPADPGTLTAYVEIYNPSNVLLKSAAVTPGSKLTGLSLAAGVDYTIKVYAKDAFGNKGPETSLSYTSFKCPTGYAYIHNSGSTSYSSPFCVGVTEAKVVSSKAVHEVGLAPTISITLSAASIYCQNTTESGFSGTFRLITNNQWNAVADHLASQAANWSGAAVGAGYLSVGLYNAGDDPIASSSSNACEPFDCSNHVFIRYLTTARNEKIYDFSGNAAEFVADTDGAKYNVNNLPIALTTPFTIPKSETLMLKYGTSQSCSSPNLAPYCGLGSLFFYCSEFLDPSACSGSQGTSATQTVVVRGGSVKSTMSYTAGETAGVFAAQRSLTTHSDASGKAAHVGFRCVYNP